MEKILKIALDADSEAQRIVNAALAEKAKCEANAANAALVRDEYLNNAEKRVKEYDDKARSDFEKHSQALRAEYEKREKQLEKAYNDNASGWVEQMLKSITESI